MYSILSQPITVVYACSKPFTKMFITFFVSKAGGERMCSTLFESTIGQTLSARKSLSNDLDSLMMVLVDVAETLGYIYQKDMDNVARCQVAMSVYEHVMSSSRLGSPP
jgi:hypothetical protein